MAEAPVTEPWTQQDPEIPLDRVVPGLAKGQVLLLAGKRARVVLTDPSLVETPPKPGAKATKAKNAEVRLMGDDGVPSKGKAQRGDSFLLVERPRESGSLLLWRLLDAQGFEGTLLAPKAAFRWAPALESDTVFSERVAVKSVTGENTPTVLTLDALPRRLYDPATMTLTANVVDATHGETVLEEVIGRGDARVPHPRFRLRKAPLTHEPAPTPRGGVPALTVRVNGVAWKERPSLHGLAPSDEAYAVRIDDDAVATIQFGDGLSGARLPTGEENVTATYRTGLGRAGNVSAGALKLLQDRPLGVKEVTNPVPATGGEDPEKLADARSNAPVTVLTLERIVSLHDHTDFANAFSGVGKAQAEAVTVGEDSLVLLTVADSLGDPLDPESKLAENLAAGMKAAREQGAPLVILPYVKRAFRVHLLLKVDTRYVKEKVHEAVEAALRDAFSFGRRAFGQFVTASEVVAVAQSVPGVVAVDLEALHDAQDAPVKPPPAHLAAERGRHDEEHGLLAAQLFLLDEIKLGDMEDSG